MTLSCSVLHTICEICMAAGGLGTVGTLIYMICDSKRKTKQIETVQNIQSYQLESLYEPDVRISSYGSIQNDIVINNRGENLILLGVNELSDSNQLNKEGMNTWFPLPFDKDAEIHIPLLNPPTKIQMLCMSIECKNRLGLIYKINVDICDGKPTISIPRKK